MSVNAYNNADSLVYLQECINDLQTRFYGLQLEHLQKQEQQKMLSALPSLNNSIWATQPANPNRPSSRSSSAGSVTSASGTSDRDSSSSQGSMRSISPDLSQSSIAQLNAAAAFWPQAAATAATLAAFMPNMPKGVNQFNPMEQQMGMLANQQQSMQQMQLNMQQQKPRVISPIGTGKPKSVYQTNSQNQYQHQQFDQRTNNTFQPSFKLNRKIVQKKPTISLNKKQAEKPKQGPFNKVLIVGLAPEYRSLNGVLDIFRPYGDVVSARVYRPQGTLPSEITRWVPSAEVQGAYCAVIEYPTARCAKFAVGVLRERVTSNKYRVVLLKPGAYEELQRQQVLIANTVAAAAGKPTDEAHSDSGNESLERSSRSSDCLSD